MKPLIWDIPDDFKERHYMDYNWRPMEKRTSSSIFMQGKHLPCADVGGIKCSQDPKEYDLIFASSVLPKEFTKFDCLPNNSTAPLVNQKVLDILNKLCSNDIQAFPATIIPDKGSRNNFENHDYWVINITKKSEAIDRDNTEFLYLSKSLGGDPYGTKKLVLSEYTEHFLSRDETLKTLKIVSPSLVQAFKKAGVTGVQFIEDKDYF